MKRVTVLEVSNYYKLSCKSTDDLQEEVRYLEEVCTPDSKGNYKIPFDEMGYCLSYLIKGKYPIVKMGSENFKTRDRPNPETFTSLYVEYNDLVKSGLYVDYFTIPPYLGIFTAYLSHAKSAIESVLSYRELLNRPRNSSYYHWGCVYTYPDGQIKLDPKRYWLPFNWTRSLTEDVTK